MNKQAALKELRTIPGVGTAVSLDLWNLGIRKISDLKGKSPEKLYDKLCALQQASVDRCMLYTFRCAVYFASTKKPQKEKLLWWNWKDK